jgi:tetratricopeptide (TPR) repeat protein
MNRRSEYWRSLIAFFLAASWLSARAAPEEAAIQRAAGLDDRVQQLYEGGSFQQALPLALDTLNIRESLLGPEHPDTAASLDQLARLHTATAAFAKAEPLYQRAIAIRTQALGAESPETAKSLHNLAELYARDGSYAKAEQVHKRALAIREKVLGPEHPDTDESLTSLALIYLDTAAYVKAEPLFLRSLSISRKTLGSEHTNTARAMHNLARLYTNTGEYTKAEPMMQEAVAIDEKAFGPDHRNVATSLTNLGTVYSRMHAYARAEPLLQRAVAIQEKISGPEHLDTADPISNLAVTYLRTGKYAEAEALFGRALLIQQKALGIGHPRVASSLDDLAEVYRQSNAYARAEPLHHQAIATLEKTVGLEHRLTVYALRRLAATQWAMGSSAQALSTFERYQKAQTKNTDRFLLTGSESRKLAYLQSRREEISTDISFSVATASPEAAAFGLNTVLQYKGRVEDAMSDSVARLRRSLKGEGPEILEQLAAVATRISTLAYQGPGNLSVGAYREHLARLTREQEDLEAQLAKRSSEFRRQIAPVTIQAVQRQLPKNTVLVEWFRYQAYDPRAAVHAQTREPRYVAYVLKHTGDPAVIDIGGAQQIEAAVRGFTAAVRSPRREGFKVLAADLSDRLLAHLRPHLMGAERVLMSPDAALNLVPMAALLDERGEYLVRSLEISYLTSGRDLLRLASSSAARSNPVILGSPAYGELSGLPVDIASPNEPTRSADLDRSELRFRPLLGTVLEIQALKRLMKLQDTDVLMGSKASEARLKQLRAPRILHIATHGFFLSDQQVEAELNARGERVDAATAPIRENPLLRSGLALAGANQRRSGKEDGILTACEWYRVVLRGHRSDGRLYGIQPLDDRQDDGYRATCGGRAGQRRFSDSSRLDSHLSSAANFRQCGHRIQQEWR